MPAPGVFGALLICLAPVATDGDTVRCGAGKDEARIRMWGVQHVDGTHVEPARLALQRQVEGGIVCEPRGTSYSRIVGLCYNGTDRDVSRQLLEVEQTVQEWCTYSRGYYGTCAAGTAAGQVRKEP